MEQLAVEQETIPHGRTTMALVILYRPVLVVDNITPIVVAIRCMYQRDKYIISNNKSDMTTMKRISSVFAVMAIIVCCSCGGGTKPNPESRTYENAYKSSSTATETETDNPYLENKL